MDPTPDSDSATAPPGLPGPHPPEPPHDDPARPVVLVVEDEASYREAMTVGLRHEGFAVRTAVDGASALRSVTEERPDIVLLDVLLPDMSGTEVCRRLRQLTPVPVVLVSAIDAELDVVLGLELGAEDYVTKPFHLRELVARINAILRRVSAVNHPSSRPWQPGSSPDGAARSAAEPTGSSRTGSVLRQPASQAADQTLRRNVEHGALTVGRVRVDTVRREVTVDGEPVHLSRREFDLLALLLSPPSQVRTRDELIDLLWPDRDLADSRTLDTHVHRLRSKLEVDPAHPRLIVTVRGVGFRLDTEAPRVPAPSRQEPSAD
ncbi:MAG: response regulator transcription factor [Acidimicrobiales bacterium]